MLRNLGCAIFCAVAMVSMGWCDELPEGITCPVSNEEVDPEMSREYRDGKVYFCCEKCVAAFEKDAAPFAEKANAQLVATKQYQQKACPISGRPTKAGVTVSVDGQQVGVCCPNCQKKINDSSEDEKRALVFSDAAFDKAFEPVAEPAAVK